MLKKWIAWITIIGMLTVYGVVGDAADILSAALEAMTVGALAEDGDFTIDENGVLTKYNGSAAVVVVPEGVTGIGEYAFNSCASVERVTLPNSVTVLGNCAFQYCEKLEEIEIGTGLTTLGYNVFYGCGSLGDLYPPFLIPHSSLYAYTLNSNYPLG